PAKVELKTLRRKVESTGEVRPDNRLEVKSPIAGRIETLLVNEGDLVQKGQIVAWISSTERATLLDTARAKGDAELKYWEEIYKAAPLVAPLSGTVIVRSLEPGQTITSSSAVLVIADQLIVVGQVDETDIGAISIGQHVNVKLDAYPNAAFEGSVKRIAYDSKMVSNVTMYEVDVSPENLPSFARSGMTATLTFLVEEHTNVPAVPTAALEYRKGKAFVRLPAKDGKEPEAKPVTTGISENSFTEITKGLEAGDEVLIPQIVRKKDVGANPFMPGSTGARPQQTGSPGARPQAGGAQR
ncbi:MAG: efflux RND transporter periplasmic adaptor subunit, partial [Verrucomicrobia bacterium]|nr:efflux RND transporter periplasmic adaptor subunit [Verrucomicrobiota bacterium]